MCSSKALHSGNQALPPVIYSSIQIAISRSRALICGLPVEYNALHQTLLLDDSLTLEKLQDTCVALENQPGVPSLTLSLSHAASTLSCTFCGCSGHPED
ncbi:hypothetical protein GY45DRAFT_1395194 [Cubamyces sp. BRFM 1775]|nr:hypothetical protein GY45DRAFT_1395194 [Cubamyces sp. BRFM 1775]